MIANGLGYDAWLTKLAKSSPKSQLVEVGEDVLHDKMGQNPHLWNDPNTMIQSAHYLADLLSKKIPPTRQTIKPTLRNISPACNPSLI